MASSEFVEAAAITAPLLRPSSSNSSSTTSSASSLVKSYNSTASPLPAPTTSHDHAPQRLSPSSTLTLTLSRVLGSGIFATPGAILLAAGSPGLALLLWLLGALLISASLAISLEYGCMLPVSGGPKVYLETAYRRPRFLASTMVATQALLLGFSASNCVVWGRYVGFALGWGEASDGWSKGMAVGLLTVITVVHGRWRDVGVRVQDALGWVKVGLAGFMALTGAWVVLFGLETVDAPGREALRWGNLWAGSRWTDVAALQTALFKVFYSYAGLDNVNNVLGEVRDPVRTLRRVVPAALAVSTALYLLVNVAYFVVVPAAEIKDGGELVAALFFTRVFGPGLGRRILPLAIAISAAGNVMVVTFALARLNQAIARQGFLPFPHLLSTSRPFGTPLGGLLVHYLPSVLVITLPPAGDVYNFILDVEGYPGVFFGLATAVGLLKLRRERPGWPRPFRAWLPAVWVRIAVALALVVAPFFPNPSSREGGGGSGDVEGLWYATYAVVGVGVILFGLLYWYLWTVLIPRWRGYRLEEAEEVLRDGTRMTRLVHVKVR